MGKKRRGKPPRTPHAWLNPPSAPVTETVVHATKVTVPPSHAAAYEEMWSRSEVLANARAAAEAEGLNPLAVLHAVFERMGSSPGLAAMGGTGLKVTVVGAPEDVARVYLLAETLWRGSPGAQVFGTGEP